jgi:ABC-type amino acid transport substrate-binding protein
VPESVVERLKRPGHDRIRVGVVYNRPFAFGDPARPEGFVVDIFEHVSRLLTGKEPEYRHPEGSFYTFAQVDEALSRREIDVVVSAVIPTFGRQQHMWFSRPLPFVRLPLSALVRSAAVRSAPSLTVQKVLSWQRESDEQLAKLRLLTVAGEAGAEFAATFLPGARATTWSAKSLDERQLHEEFVGGQYDLLIADLGTCEGVYRHELESVGPGRTPRIEKLREDPKDPTGEVAATLAQSRYGLPVLALFPVALALPSGDRQWRDLVDQALSSLLADGIRPLLQLYRKYIGTHSLGTFCISDDENVTSPHTARAFGELFQNLREEAAVAERYTSPGLGRSFFRRLGNLHLHVDGGRQHHLIARVVKQLEQQGAPGKIEHVRASIDGPQRSDPTLVGTYMSHTPGGIGAERFECFSTSHLLNREHAIEKALAALMATAKVEGLVVELEQVVACIDADGRWSELQKGEEVPALGPHDAIPPAETRPYEVHHGFEIPMNGGSGPPLTLEELRDATSQAGIPTGGWFFFAPEGDVWSYRSNGFFEATGLVSEVKQQNKKLRECLRTRLQDYLKKRGTKVKVWTVVERVLGVWRTPVA